MEEYGKYPKMCQICILLPSKYTCPRCNVNYCSLACFKGNRHSSCSESFYKESFENELKQRNVSQAEKQNVMRMLQELEEEDFELNDDLLKNRLQNIDLSSCSTEQLWDCLTESEKNEFKSVIQNPDSVAQLITAWVPWWEKSAKNGITEIDETKGERKLQSINELKNSHEDNTPATQYKKQHSSNISALVKYNIVNVTFCYAYLLRYYNGDFVEFPEEICQGILNCSYLGEKISKPFLNCETAIGRAAEKCIVLCKNANWLDIIAIKDTIEIVKGTSPQIKNYAKHMLHEIKTLLISARKRVKLKAHKNKLFNAEKKLQFLDSWFTDNQSEILMLDLELCTIYTKRNEREKEKMLLGNSTQNKTTKTNQLIQIIES